MINSLSLKGTFTYDNLTIFTIKIKLKTISIYEQLLKMTKICRKYRNDLEKLPTLWVLLKTI